MDRKVKGEWLWQEKMIILKSLRKKEIYEFLEGNGPFLVTHNGAEYGLPYYKGTQLSSLCTEFGLTEVVGGSRMVLCRRNCLIMPLSNSVVMNCLDCYLAKNSLLIYRTLPI